MLAVLDMAVVFPESSEQLEEAAFSLGLSKVDVKMFARFYGLDRFHVDHSQPLSDLVGKALSTLLSRNNNSAHAIQLILHCTTLPSTTPFGTGFVNLIASRHISDHAEKLSVTMNHCATALSALELLSVMLSKDKVAVLLVGEKAFHRTVRLIENTTVMGEAAVAILIGRGPGPFQYIGGHTCHHGAKSICSGHSMERSFVPTPDEYYRLIVKTVNELLLREDIQKSDVVRICPHNVNMSSWVQVARLLNISLETVHTQNISRHGHCFGADPFINLQDAFDTGAVQQGDLVVLVSAGLGATVSAALMRVGSAVENCK